MLNLSLISVKASKNIKILGLLAKFILVFISALTGAIKLAEAENYSSGYSRLF